MRYFTYILHCADNTLYTGYTNDLEKRVITHNNGKGAKYTRGRLPVRLLYSESFTSESEARKREIVIKHLSRKSKEALIESAHGDTYTRDL